MKVEKISLKNVGPYTNLELELPATGLVLVTGKNGAGKSVLWESIEAALWDTTSREGLLWANDKGEIQLLADGHLVTRRASGKAKLLLNGHTGEKISYTQKEVNSIFGERADWRLSSVLTSGDYPELTRGTDSVRTRALESLLGVEVLDRAGDSANKELRTAQNDFAAASRDVAACQEIARKAAESAQLVQGLAIPVDDEDSPAQLQEAARDLSKLQQQAEALSSRIARHEHELEQIRKSKALLAKDVCPTCERPFDDQYKSDSGNDLCIQAAEVRALLMKDRGDYEELRSRISAAQAHKTRLVQIIQAKARAAEVVAAAKKAAAAYDEAKLNEQLAKDKLEMRLEEKTMAEHVAKILSPRGVRSKLLLGAARALESAGTAWLQRLCSDKVSLSVKVLEQGEKSKVVLSVDGFGGKYGYASASEGQRRRVDIAVQLAKMQIASAARGVVHSPLILDDVLGVMDDEGVELAAIALAEFAKTRCVLLTAQRAAECVRGVATRHLFVADGKVRDL